MGHGKDTSGTGEGRTVVSKEDLEYSKGLSCLQWGVSEEQPHPHPVNECPLAVPFPAVCAPTQQSGAACDGQAAFWGTGDRPRNPALLPLP